MLWLVAALKADLMRARAISIKGLNAKTAKLSYIHQINQENKLHLLEESKVIFNAFLKD